MGVTAKTIIDYSISQIGTKEIPSGSNNVKYNTLYYGRQVSGADYPWCCAFVWYVFQLCNASKLFYDGKKTAYCPTVESWAKSKKRFYSNTNGQPGDLCLMDFGKGRASHIGIVEKKNSDGTYNVIEGNTSTSSNDNGGCVMRRVRKTSVIRGFARPNYDNQQDKTTQDIGNINTYTRTDFIKEVQSAIGAKVDGKAGKETLSKTVTVSKSKNNKHAVVKPLQKYLNSIGYNCGTADGVAGSKFDKAIKEYQSKVVGLKTPDGELTACGKSWKTLLGLA